MADNEERDLLAELTELKERLNKLEQYVLQLPLVLGHDHLDHKVVYPLA